MNSSTPDKKRNTILITDDASVNRLILRKIFSGEYDILEAGDGVAALESLRSHTEISVMILDIMMPELDGFGVLEQMRADSSISEIPVIVVTSSDEPQSQIRALSLGASDFISKPYNPQIIYHRVRNLILRRESEQLLQKNRLFEQQLRQQEEYIRRSEIEGKTGCYNKDAFCRYTLSMLTANPDRKFVLFRWDIDRFKVFNDIYGSASGDALLARTGEFLRQIAHTGMLEGRMTYGHCEADHFVVCMENGALTPEKLLDGLQRMFSQAFPDFEFVPHLGAYLIETGETDVNVMCDRALLALRSTKGNYVVRFAYFDQPMRSELIAEQEIIGNMSAALSEGQFVIYLQPQVDYSAKKFIGAEALVRWIHPQKGIITPASFIPILERNGMIARLDEYVWECACRQLRRWIDAGIEPLPISVNLSRVDIYNSRLYEIICGLTRRYGVEPGLLRLEITESAYMDNPKQLISFVERIREAGFTVEMDDFGSNYSSLNTLKDVPVDILKLDMKFLGGTTRNSRGGSILSSIVRMAHWLNLPVIAEGIETSEQTDYLKSIGCIYMQGYYFARPMPTSDFERLLTSESAAGNTRTGFQVRFQEKSDDRQADFWNASEQATLLFNSYVGGAAIIEYVNGNVEALRINDRFLDELGVTREEYLRSQNHLLDSFEGEHRTSFWHILETAYETSGETSGEVRIKPTGSSEERWIRIHARFIAQNVDYYIFYIMIENITESIRKINESKRLSERLNSALDSLGRVMIFETHAGGIRLAHCSGSAAEFFGFTRDQLDGLEGNPNPIHPDDLIRLAESFAEKLERISIRFLASDDSWRPVSLRLGEPRPCPDGDSFISAVIE